MANNDECNLFCWWNVIPGETGEEAAREMFAAKGVDDWVVSFDETYAIIGLGYGTPDSSSFTRDVIVQFGLENNLIQYIGVDGGYRREDLRSIFVRDWQSYGPAQLLNRHGMPSYVEFIEVGNSPYYRLVLSYEELGIEINYTTRFEPIENGQERICFNLEKIDFIGLTLYPPGKASDVPFGIIPNRLDSYTSWESATGLSLENFQELFNDPNNTPCIEVN